MWNQSVNMAEVIEVEIEQASEQEQREEEKMRLFQFCHAYDRLLQVIYLEKENW